MKPLKRTLWLIKLMLLISVLSVTFPLLIPIGIALNKDLLFGSFNLIGRYPE